MNPIFDISISGFSAENALACGVLAGRAYTEKTFEVRATDSQVLIQEQEDCLLVAFRGSESLRDFLTDGKFWPVSLPDGKIHAGFWSAWMSLRQPLTDALAEIESRRGNLPRLVFTGHSLGGALASLAAFHFRHRPCSTHYTFGAPRVGDSIFRDNYNGTLLPSTYRCVRTGDIVPHVLPLLYRHVGHEVALRDGAATQDRSLTSLLVADAQTVLRAARAVKNGEFWLGDDIAHEHGIAGYINDLSELIAEPIEQKDAKDAKVGYDSPNLAQATETVRQP